VKAATSLICLTLLAAACLDAQARPRRAKKKREVILLGQLDAKTILEREPKFEKRRKMYRPDKDAVATLAAHGEKCTVRVFLGTWCDDSQKHVGAFFKIIEKAGNKRIECDYYGVDRAKQDPDGLAKKHKIEKVPTFILLVEGREVGRIVEKPKQRIEDDVVKLLEAATADEEKP
jgi:hypothetical protein